MSANGVTNAGFNFALLNQGNTSNPKSVSGAGTDAFATAPASESFRASLALQLASFQSQTLSTLTGSSANPGTIADSNGLEALLASQNTSGDLLSVIGNTRIEGLSAIGRNASLYDPESAYNMMSLINNAEAVYKGQFAKLAEMKSQVSEMQHDGERLGNIGTSSSNDSIKAQLQEFAGQYNDWVRRFDDDMQADGVLANTQAAQIARRELAQSIGNIFNGAKDGVRGLGDLGFNIDPVSKQAVLDTAKLDTVLASNKQGAVSAVQEFSANFVRSAELLNSAGNFISNRLNNLGGFIHYVAEHKSSLQAEFGLGDVAQPSGKTAQALANYKQIYGS